MRQRVPQAALRMLSVMPMRFVTGMPVYPFNQTAQLAVSQANVCLVIAKMGIAALQEIAVQRPPIVPTPIGSFPRVATRRAVRVREWMQHAN